MSSAAPELRLSCSAEPVAALASPAEALLETIPSCAKAPGLIMTPPLSIVSNGSAVVLSVSLTTSAGVFPSNAALCEAALRCDLTRADGGSLLARSYIPLVAVAPRVPLLDDIVLEHDEVSASGSASLSVSMKSLWGRWTTVPLPSPAAPEAPNGTAAALLRIRAAEKLSQQARNASADDVASLSLLTSGNATATLLAAAASVFQGTGPFAAAWQAHFKGASVTMLLADNGTLHSLPLAVQTIEAAGTTARVSLPPLDAVCKRAGRRTLCPDVALSICTAGASDEDLAGLVGIRGGALAPFVARVGAVGVGTSLTLPPFLLSKSVLGAAAGGTPEDVPRTGTWGALADVLPLGAKWQPPQVLAATPSGSSISAAPEVSAGTASLASEQQFGAAAFRYVESCSLLGDFIDPTTSDVCVDINNQLRAKCALGSGASCRPCPSDRALCPGGDALIPLPGWWVPDVAAGSESDIIKCVGGNAAKRCPGGVTERGLSRCGPEFNPASFGCSTCAAGYYPSEDDPGACVRCPPQGSVLAGLTNVLAVIGWILLSTMPFALLVGAVTKRVRGSAKEGLKVGLRFYLQAWAALQILVQAAVVTDVLPPLTAKLFARLQLLQFQGVAVHPLCEDGGGAGPLAPSITSLAFALVLLAMLAVNAYGAHRSMRSVAARGLPKAAAARRALSRALATAATKATQHADLLLQVAATMAVILYGRTIGIAYKLLACSELVTMPVLSYLALPTRDGAALAAAGLPFGLDAALQCAGLPGASAGAAPMSRYECARILPQLLLPVNITTLLSQPYIVCGEGPHPGARALAVATIALYGALLPLGVYVFLLWRRKRLRLSLQPPPLQSTPRGRRPLPWWRGCVPSKDALPCVPLSRPALSSFDFDAAGANDKSCLHLRSRCKLRVCPAAVPEPPAEKDPLLRFFAAGAFREDRAVFFVVDLLALQVFAALAAFWSPAQTTGGAHAALALSMTTLAYLSLHIVLRRPHRQGSQAAIALASYALTALVMGLTYISSMTVLSRQRLQAALKAVPPDAAEAAAAQAAIDAYADKAVSVGNAVFAGTVLLGVVILGSFMGPLVDIARLARAPLTGAKPAAVSEPPAAAPPLPAPMIEAPAPARPKSLVLTAHEMQQRTSSLTEDMVSLALRSAGSEAGERVSIRPRQSMRGRPTSTAEDSSSSSGGSGEGCGITVPVLTLRAPPRLPEVKARTVPALGDDSVHTNPLAGRLLDLLAADAEM